MISLHPRETEEREERRREERRRKVMYPLLTTTYCRLAVECKLWNQQPIVNEHYVNFCTYFFRALTNLYRSLCINSSFLDTTHHLNERMISLCYYHPCLQASRNKTSNDNHGSICNINKQYVVP